MNILYTEETLKQACSDAMSAADNDGMLLFDNWWKRNKENYEPLPQEPQHPAALSMQDIEIPQFNEVYLLQANVRGKILDIDFKFGTALIEWQAADGVRSCRYDFGEFMLLIPPTAMQKIKGYTGEEKTNPRP